MVYLRATFPEVCPRCNVPGAGRWHRRARARAPTRRRTPGADCRVNGEVTVAGKGLYLLSSDCTPLNDSGPPTTLDIKLPFTTGAATPHRSDPCPATTRRSRNAGRLLRQRHLHARLHRVRPAPGLTPKGNCIDAKGGISQLCCSNTTTTPCFPTKGGGSIARTGYPGTDGQTLVNAATFCIAHTNSTLINMTTGLPGPGALLLPATVTVSKSSSPRGSGRL